MKELELRKSRLAQKKAQLLKEEILVKLNEKKAKNARLIESANLISKLELDVLSLDILCGALIFVKQTLTSNPDVLENWSLAGNQKLQEFQNKKSAPEKTPLLLTINSQIDQNLKTQLRHHGLKWNHIRSEWQGYVSNPELIKQLLVTHDFNIQIMKQST